MTATIKHLASMALAWKGKADKCVQIVAAIIWFGLLISFLIVVAALPIYCLIWYPGALPLGLGLFVAVAFTSLEDSQPFATILYGFADFTRRHPRWSLMYRLVSIVVAFPGIWIEIGAEWSVLQAFMLNTVFATLLLSSLALAQGEKRVRPAVAYRNLEKGERAVKILQLIAAVIQLLLALWLRVSYNDAGGRVPEEFAFAWLVLTAHNQRTPAVIFFAMAIFIVLLERIERDFGWRMAALRMSDDFKADVMSTMAARFAMLSYVSTAATIVSFFLGARMKNFVWGSALLLGGTALKLFLTVTAGRTMPRQSVVADE